MPNQNSRKEKVWQTDTTWLQENCIAIVIKIMRHWQKNRNISMGQNREPRNKALNFAN
jgi:hypothetical protein